MQESDYETQSSESKPTPRWGLVATLLWSALVASVFLVVQGLILAVIVADAHHGISRTRPEIVEQLRLAAINGTIISYITCATALVCTGLLVAIIKLKRGAMLRAYLCLKSVAIADVLKWSVLTAALIFISDIITILRGRSIVPDFSRTAYTTADPIWLFWVAFVLAAPLSEEIFFRGFLFRGIETSALKPTGAIIVTAALWTMLHIQYDAYILVSVFCSGLLLGAARVATGSLLLPIGLHMFTNFVATSEVAVLQANS